MLKRGPESVVVLRRFTVPLRLVDEDRRREEDRLRIDDTLERERERERVGAISLLVIHFEKKKIIIYLK